MDASDVNFTVTPDAVDEQRANAMSEQIAQMIREEAAVASKRDVECVLRKFIQLILKEGAWDAPSYWRLAQMAVGDKTPVDHVQRCLHKKCKNTPLVNCWYCSAHKDQEPSVVVRPQPLVIKRNPAGPHESDDLYDM
jgi:hypothetical protein